MRILKLILISMFVDILFLKDSVLVIVILNYCELVSSLVLFFFIVVIILCKDFFDFIYLLKYNCREINECEIGFYK